MREGDRLLLPEAEAVGVAVADTVREEALPLGVHVLEAEALLVADCGERLPDKVADAEGVALRVAVHARLALGVCDTDAVADAEPALDSVRLAVALPDGAVAVGLREVVNDEPDRVAVAVAVCVPDRVPWQVALGVGVAVMRDDGDGEGDGVSESDAVLEAEALGVGETVEDRDGVRDVGVREGVGESARLPEGEADANGVPVCVCEQVRDAEEAVTEALAVVVAVVVGVLALRDAAVGVALQVADAALLDCERRGVSDAVREGDGREAVGVDRDGDGLAVAMAERVAVGGDAVGVREVVHVRVMEDGVGEPLPVTGGVRAALRVGVKDGVGLGEGVPVPAVLGDRDGLRLTEEVALGRAEGLRLHEGVMVDTVPVLDGGLAVMEVAAEGTWVGLLVTESVAGQLSVGVAELAEAVAVGEGDPVEDGAGAPDAVRVGVGLDDAVRDREAEREMVGVTEDRVGEAGDAVGEADRVAVAVRGPLGLRDGEEVADVREPDAVGVADRVSVAVDAVGVGVGLRDVVHLGEIERLQVLVGVAVPGPVSKGVPVGVPVCVAEGANDGVPGNVWLQVPEALRVVAVRVGRDGLDVMEHDPDTVTESGRVPLGGDAVSVVGVVVREVVRLAVAFREGLFDDEGLSVAVGVADGRDRDSRKPRVGLGVRDSDTVRVWEPLEDADRVHVAEEVAVQEGVQDDTLRVRVPVGVMVPGLRVVAGVGLRVRVRVAVEVAYPERVAERVLPVGVRLRVWLRLLHVRLHVGLCVGPERVLVHEDGLRLADAEVVRVAEADAPHVRLRVREQEAVGLPRPVIRADAVDVPVGVGVLEDEHVTVDGERLPGLPEAAGVPVPVAVGLGVAVWDAEGLQDAERDGVRDVAVVDRDRVRGGEGQRERVRVRELLRVSVALPESRLVMDRLWELDGVPEAVEVCVSRALRDVEGVGGRERELEAVHVRERLGTGEGVPLRVREGTTEAVDDGLRVRVAEREGVGRVCVRLRDKDRSPVGVCETVRVGVPLRERDAVRAPVRVAVALESE